MFRVVNLFVLMITIVTAFALYRVKYEVGAEARQVADLRRQVQREADAIALLQAEWGHLIEPGRIQKLADRYLDLKPVQARQIVSLRDLPGRAREPLVGHAGIGGEAIVTGSVR